MRNVLSFLNTKTITGICYAFALEDGGRLAPMAAELVDRIMAILVAVRRFHGMDALDSRSLRYDIYVRMQQFARRTSSIPFRRFGGCARIIHATSSMVLWAPISVMLCKRVVRMLWHAFLFLGLLDFFLFSSFCLVAYDAFSCKEY
jgi:hypothetical protein